MNPFSALWNGLLDLIGSGLAFFYDIVPNYGIAIILLTVVIMLLLFPLTLKQTRSMRAMQTIQPEVKRIQKEHRDDREEMNKQLMALYQERGVNPAAGCLPLLLQGPIWFALFRVLSVGTDAETGMPTISDSIPADSAIRDALEAGKATFLNMDLLLTPGDALGVSIGQAIPYIILIIIVVAAGFFQQHQMMRARSGSPQQEQSAQTQSVQRAMRFMPLIIGVFSWRFPGGLVLYFAASNLFRIAQQAVILRDERTNGTTPEAIAETTPEVVEEPPAKPPTKRSPNASKKKKRKRK